MKKLLIIILLLLPTMAFSAVTDSDPTEAEVTALIAGMSAGDTLTFMGSATWTSSVTVGKAITIDGNGYTLTAGGTLTNGFFYITNFTDATTLMRITGFTLVNLTDLDIASRNIRVLNSISLGSLRIDNNNLYYGYESIEVAGSYGVIDNNHFYNARKGISFTAGSRTQQDASWTSLAAGTANALFIEDNHFIDNADYPETYKQEKIGTYGGGKLVIRYNEFDFDAIPIPDTNTDVIITHGSAGNYWQIGVSESYRRGQSVVEIYNNNIHAHRIDFPIVIRGSANLIYNNAVVQAHTAVPKFKLWEEEYDQTGNWTVLRDAWPAEDQVHNSFIWGNTYNGAAYFDQAAHFAVIPSNSNCDGNLDPLPCCTGVGTGTCGDGTAQTTNPFIQLDRDFFLHAPLAAGTGTDGAETFTGSNGGSNTAPTDGITYPTLGNMVFTADVDNAYLGYVGYAYPHPLRGERLRVGSGPAFQFTGPAITLN